MKKPLLTIFLALTATFAFAQGNGGQLSYSIAAGGALAYFQAKAPAGTTISNSPQAVGCAGVTINYKFNDYFSISPGLLLSGKGGQTSTSNQITNNASTSYELYYLEGSFYFTGHIPVADRANIFLGTGPFYSYGIFGKIKDDDAGTSQSARFGNSGDFKRNDYGITSLIGFESENGFIVSLNFDLGLLNVHQNNPNIIDNVPFKSRSFYISVGKSF